MSDVERDLNALERGVAKMKYKLDKRKDVVENAVIQKICPKCKRMERFTMQSGVFKERCNKCESRIKHYRSHKPMRLSELAFGGK